jgi:hypothetical protein
MSLSAAEYVRHKNATTRPGLPPAALRCLRKANACIKRFRRLEQPRTLHGYPGITPRPKGRRAKRHGSHFKNQIRWLTKFHAIMGQLIITSV